MSLFKILLSLCDELCSLFLNFWWGTSDGKRKIAWFKRNAICKPKALGELGFRDIGLFNQALVAKQAWLLITSPTSLLYQVFYEKYFQDSSFLFAEDKNGSSWLWKSVLWGTELSLKGMRWRVGNGNLIRVFADPWLPRPFSFLLITCNTLSLLKFKDLMMFSCLLIVSGLWLTHSWLGIGSTLLFGILTNRDPTQ